MRVLITGNRGFVGRHLQAAFEARGDQVVGCDIKAGYDCLDFFRFDHLGLEFRGPFDLAIHCAANVGGRANIDGSPLAVATNLALDSWFFQWLKTSGTPRAVYYSSSAAYPTSLQYGDLAHRLNEDTPLRAHLADQTYGLVKVVGEQLAAEARRSGIDVLVLRPFSGYGSDQDLDYPFPSLIRRALDRADPFEIWGDGLQTRDWIHIDDVVGATLAALGLGHSGPINLGTGVATTFNQLASMICARVPGYRTEWRHLLDKPTGVQYRVADVSRLTQFYAPAVSLSEGIERAIEEGRR